MSTDEIIEALMQGKVIHYDKQDYINTKGVELDFIRLKLRERGMGCASLPPLTPSETHMILTARPLPKVSP